MVISTIAYSKSFTACFPFITSIIVKFDTVKKGSITTTKKK